MIQFDGVTKAFAEDRLILDDFSLEVPDGKITILLGRSGAGKSVLLKHVVGLIRPDAGRVLVDDEVVDADDPDGLVAIRQRIGYVFQFAALFDSMTVAENLELGLRRQGLGTAEMADRIRESLEVVGLPETADRLPGTLSGGMRKRIGIARAIALRPRYILWDEPTTGLDPVTTATIDRLIRRITDEFGSTGLVVTHDMRSATTIGDHVAMLHEGRLRFSGSVADLQAVTDPVVRGFIEGRPE